MKNLLAIVTIRTCLSPLILADVWEVCILARRISTKAAMKSYRLFPLFHIKPIAGILTSGFNFHFSYG